MTHFKFPVKRFDNKELQNKFAKNPLHYYAIRDRFFRILDQKVSWNL